MLFELLFKKKDSPQYLVRLALSKFIGETGNYSFALLSKEIGINHKTLLDFLQKEKDIEFMVLLKIVGWLEKNDKNYIPTK